MAGVPALDVRLLSLACCGVEAATGIDGWRRWAEASAAIPHRSDGPSGGNAVPVLVVAGTITIAAAPRVSDVVSALPRGSRIVLFGACSVSGGPYWDSLVVVPGFGELPSSGRSPERPAFDPIEVPGCPPTPAALCDVLVRLQSGSGFPAAAAGFGPPAVVGD